MQTKKECQIELSHLKTHKDTARRLRAVVHREGQLQEELQAKQQHITAEMQECALTAALAMLLFGIVCSM